MWAFGCVLYEMLSGRRAFAGADVADTLSRVLQREPDSAALPDTTPPAVPAASCPLLREGSEPTVRWIAAAAFLIDNMLSGSSGSSAPAVPVRMTAHRSFLSALLVGAILGRRYG